MYQDLRELTLEAKRKAARRRHMVVPARRRPLEGRRDRGRRRRLRGADRAQLGAHIVKIKPPTAHIEQAEAKKVFEKYAIPTKTLADRVRHCVQSAFNGKRILIFSGGETRDTASLLADVKEMAAGGAFGAIMGRNAFQRPKPDALKPPAVGHRHLQSRALTASRPTAVALAAALLAACASPHVRRPLEEEPFVLSPGPPPSMAAPVVLREAAGRTAIERIGPGGRIPSSTRRWQGGRRCCSSTRGRSTTCSRGGSRASFRTPRLRAGRRP